MIMIEMIDNFLLASIYLSYQLVTSKQNSAWRNKYPEPLRQTVTHD